MIGAWPFGEGASGEVTSDLRPEGGGEAQEDVRKAPGRWNSQGQGAGAGRIWSGQGVEKRERGWKGGTR